MVGLHHPSSSPRHHATAAGLAGLNQQDVNNFFREDHADGPGQQQPTMQLAEQPTQHDVNKFFKQ